MQKFEKSKKKAKNEDLSRNHEFRIKYRKRLQDDMEREKELKEWLEHASESVQDGLRRDDFQG